MLSHAVTMRILRRWSRILSGLWRVPFALAPLEHGIQDRPGPRKKARRDGGRVHVLELLPAEKSIEYQRM